MDSSELLEYLDIPFRFQERPVPLAPQLRTVWGLTILVLILKICSRGQRSSVSRLHLLNWAMRNHENANRMINILENRSSPMVNLIQCDPSFTKAIEYAVAEGLVRMENNGRVCLQDTGKKFFRGMLARGEEVLEEQRIFCYGEIGNTIVKIILNHGIIFTAS
jgi:hypothetical protein